MTFELLPFQARAADQIARRYSLLASDDMRPMEHRRWPTPFYQALAAITGSGKTAMLADAVAQIRARMESEPLVLWVSKSKAVVAQTLANFEPGGKYESLIEGFVAVGFGSLSQALIEDDTQAVLATSTVGLFNRDDVRVHRPAEDSSSLAPWQLLKRRAPDGAKERRPLVVVYDEGHNLTDQQTDYLFELEPDVLLVASATMRTPGRLGQIIDRFVAAGWHKGTLDDPSDPTAEPTRGLVTTVRSSDVVDAGLVKRQIVVGGYATEMEGALNDVVAEFADVSAKAEVLHPTFRPKAIYVCKTNISQDDGTADLHARPFDQRRAPPILIWRYLVEQAGVKPEEIAVYCDLRFDRKSFPPPPDFKHFSGGEDDFAAFSAGGFRHVIFNQSLQEGWDDPECCIAYIDKSMGSQVQIEQVIGRVLRQPGARHYPDQALNTATFVIRMNSKQEFPQILDTVRRKIAADLPEVKLEGFSSRKDREKSKLKPKVSTEVPEIHIDADAALKPLREVVASITDYTADTGVNVEGPGQVTRATQAIGDGSAAVMVDEDRAHSNRVIARWLIRRQMMALYPEAAKTVDWADPRFEVLIEITSRAASHLQHKAEELVDCYLENADLAFEAKNLYRPGEILVQPDKLVRFDNAVHEGYSDLSDAFERPFAEAIDQTSLTWCRNPTNGGYAIPLLQKSSTRNFYPDFLVWKDGLIYAIDPKGDHLIQSDAGRKLLAISDETGKQKVIVKLITEGKWDADTFKRKSAGGYSVWGLRKNGKIHCVSAATPTDVIRRALEMP